MKNHVKLQELQIRPLGEDPPTSSFRTASPLYTAAMAGIAYEYRESERAGSHAYLEPSVRSLLRDLPQGASVLDLGCGNGSFLSRFQDRGWKLHGTDFSPSAIEMAQKSFPGIDFFLADSTAPNGEILERVGRVQAIISTEVVEHLYDPRGLILNAFALLDEGGVLVISTPYHGYLKNLLLAVTGQMDRHYTALWDHGHIKFWSRKTLSTLLTEGGFIDIQFAGSGRTPFLWKSMVLRATKPHRS